MANLLSLPNELHLLISDHLHLEDLTSFLRVSHHFAALLSSFLYNKLITHPRAGTLALSAAARLPSPDALRHLLDLGVVSLSPTPWCPSTPLHEAALHNRLSSVSLLLSRGASVNAQDHNSRRTPLHAAIRSCDASADIVKMLLVNGADVGAVDKYGVAPLGQARQSERGSIFWMLREHGAVLIGGSCCWHSSMEKVAAMEMPGVGGVGQEGVGQGCRWGERFRKRERKDGGISKGMREAVREVMRGVRIGRRKSAERS